MADGAIRGLSALDWSGVLAARTRLSSEGWRRHGLIRREEVPAAMCEGASSVRISHPSQASCWLPEARMTDAAIRGRSARPHSSGRRAHRPSRDELARSHSWAEPSAGQNSPTQGPRHRHRTAIPWRVLVTEAVHVSRHPTPHRRRSLLRGAREMDIARKARDARELTSDTLFNAIAHRMRGAASSLTFSQSPTVVGGAVRATWFVTTTKEKSFRLRKRDDPAREASKSSGNRQQ